MDRSHLRQVLWNLCDNAVKYASETGGILVELVGPVVIRQNASAPFSRYLITVTVLTPTRSIRYSSRSITDKHGGTGLGLYISRELCELNRAGLWSASPRPGGGSVFRIVFADPGTADRRHLTTHGQEP